MRVPEEVIACGARQRDGMIPCLHPSLLTRLSSRTSPGVGRGFDDSCPGVCLTSFYLRSLSRQRDNDRETSDDGGMTTPAFWKIQGVSQVVHAASWIRTAIRAVFHLLLSVIHRVSYHVDQWSSCVLRDRNRRRELSQERSMSLDLFRPI
ncbi:hypothetical protein BDZ85DRAFT_129690 [Elsinoe ampelina]|uniref:Uncharacterized protein n=1 Tax=Elsinoe ampelina TaxID=302913 RepID=A0A6A6GAE1_9PEZI|nr:hypothetical protein BDZ85DRAFT_129690 [Elsinoe ampelina]